MTMIRYECRKLCVNIMLIGLKFAFAADKINEWSMIENELKNYRTDLKILSYIGVPGLEPNELIYTYINTHKEEWFKVAKHLYDEFQKGDERYTDISNMSSTELTGYEGEFPWTVEDLVISERIYGPLHDNYHKIVDTYYARLLQKRGEKYIKTNDYYESLIKDGLL